MGRNYVQSLKASASMLLLLFLQKCGKMCYTYFSKLGDYHLKKRGDWALHAYTSLGKLSRLYISKALQFQMPALDVLLNKN